MGGVARVAVLAVLGGVLAVTAPAGHATVEEPTALGTLGGDNSSASAVSGSIVVGSSRLSDNQRTHAFAYDLAHPGMRDLGDLGGGFSAATGISGTVVIGNSMFTQSGPTRGFAYDLAGSGPMRDLGSLSPGGETMARAISESVVVGMSTAEDGYSHAFAYNLSAPTPTMVDLGTPGTPSWAVDVDGPIVVGTDNVDGQLRVFAYDLESQRRLDLSAVPAAGAVSVAGTTLVAADDTQAYVVDLSHSPATYRALGAATDGSSAVPLAASASTVAGLIGGNGSQAGDLFVADTAGGGKRDVGRIGTQSIASAVSGTVVVGQAFPQTGPWVAWAFDAAHATQLQALPAPANNDAAATGIDAASGVVVGELWSSRYGPSVAVAWRLPPADAAAPSASTPTAAPSPVAVGAPVQVTATISDASSGGSDIASAEATTNGTDWIPLTAVDGAFDSTTEHVGATLQAPSSAQVGQVCVRGTDSAGNTSAPACAELVTYDAAAGSATGRGTVTSSSGAYTTDATEAGAARFVFAAHYTKRATTPSGNASFKMSPRPISFESTSFDWLVINGSTAVLQGRGTLNNSPGYTFRITAVDAGARGAGDSFRIRITDMAGKVVYDNGPTPLTTGDIALRT